MNNADISNLDNDELFDALKASFEEMKLAILAMRKQSRNDYDEHYPAYMPEFTTDLTSQHKLSVRERAMISMTKLYGGLNSLPNSSYAEPGLLCVSEAMLKTIEEFNLHKTTFGELRQAIIDREIVSDNTLRRLIQQEMGERGFNSAIMTKGMKKISSKKLDIKRCRALIRILPSEIKGLSWTWARGHRRILHLRYAETLALAEQIPDKENRDIALSLLAGCSPKTEFARMIPCKPQLRANVVRITAGQEERSQVPISGVIAIAQKKLPEKLQWPEMSEATRHRSDRKIDHNLFIKSLNIYRYLEEAYHEQS